MAAARIKTQTVGEDLLLGDFNNEIDNIYSELNNVSGANIKDNSITAAKLVSGANPEVFFGEIFQDEVVTTGLTYVSDTGLSITLAPGTAYILKTSTTPNKLVRVEKILTTTLSLSASTTQYADLKSNGSWVVSVSSTVTTDAVRILKIVTNASIVTSQVDIADRAFGDNFSNSFGEVIGLVMTRPTVATVKIEANFSVIDSTGKFQITHNAAITGDITVSGAGGLDQGSEATDAWYAILLIDDSTGVSDPEILLVEETNWAAQTHVIPTGYDKHRRIGYVRNISGDFNNFTQQDKEVSYYAGQIATSTTSTTFIDIDLTNYVSPSAWIAIMSGFVDGGDLAKSIITDEQGSSGGSGGYLRAFINATAGGHPHNSGAISSWRQPLDSAKKYGTRTIGGSTIEQRVDGYVDPLND